MANRVEVARTLPVEEYYRNSPNARLRNFALRIQELKGEVKSSILLGAVKSIAFIAFGANAIDYGFKYSLQGNLEPGVVAAVSLSFGVVSILSAVRDFTTASIARSEFGSLTTALAAEAIAESK